MGFSQEPDGAVRSFVKSRFGVAGTIGANRSPLAPSAGIFPQYEIDHLSVRFLLRRAARIGNPE
jgi:hypothetical protein